MSPKKIAALACGMLLASPAGAYAETIDVAATVSVITGAGSLLLAGLLLLVVVQLRRVADGSAVGDHVSYVAAASVCLVAAVLVGWVDRFVNGFSGGIVRAGGDVLTMVSVLLFAVYFSRVKNSLSAFLKHLKSEEVLAVAHGADAEEDTVA